MRYLLFVLTFVSCYAFGQIPGLPELIAKTDPAVVKVYVLDERGEPVSQGSGVAISANGVFVTNFHVLEGAKDAVILTHDGKQFEVANILDYSDDKDLVKFTVNAQGSSFKTVEITTSLPLKGSNVFSLGYPNGFLMEGESTVSTGIISGSRKIGDNKLIQTTTPITHGSSGGGLFDIKGKLVGITTGTFAGNVEDLHANMNKVVPAYEINTLTEKHDWSLEEFYINTKDLTCYLTGLDLYNQQDYMRAFTVFNECIEQRKYDPHIFYLMGTCLFHIGRGATSEGYTQPDKEILTRALDFYKAALELEEDYVPVFCYSSMILEYLGDAENAFTLAQKAYELKPKSPFSNYALAKQYANKEDWGNAVKYLKSAIALAERQGNNSGYLHQYYLELAIATAWSGDVQNADKYYKKCLELNGENLDALFWYGNFLAVHERYEEACTYLTQLQSLSPNFAIGPNSVKRMVEELKCENADRGSIKEVKIGLQIWMAENLDVDHFRNGDPIPQAKTKEEWIKAGKEGKPAWCYYNNDAKNGKKYGKLYNWYAVNDPRGLAPEGWRIPNLDNWKYLIQYLGGYKEAGDKLIVNFKDSQGNKVPSSNSSGMAIAPGGLRWGNEIEQLRGNFQSEGWLVEYWTTDGSYLDKCDADKIKSYQIFPGATVHGCSDKATGLYVRCVKSISTEKKPIKMVED